MPKPQIDITQDFATLVRSSYQALVDANDADMPSTVVRSGGVISALDTEERKLRALPIESLRMRLADAASFGKFDGQGNWIALQPPKDVAKTILEAQDTDLQGLPRVTRVVDVPSVVTDADGTLTLHAVPGLHGPSRTMYVPSPGSSISVPTSGTVDTMEEVRDSVEWLHNNLLAGFTFEGGIQSADYVHAWCLMLLPFVREAIPGPTPLHAITAPASKSGKSWLATACLTPGCGVPPESSVPDIKHGYDEWRKAITSQLLDGSPAIFLDNVEGKLNAPPLLAATANQGGWRDRILGKSEMVTLPARNVWVATGNNLDLGIDMSTRALPIRLLPRSSSSPVVHSQLTEWIRTYRAEAVEHILVLLRHWLDGPISKFDPDGTMVRDAQWDPSMEGVIQTAETSGLKPHELSRFPGWYNVMHGLLGACTLSADLVLENLDDYSREVGDADSAEEREFFEAWHAVWSDKGRRVSEIETAVTIGGELHDAVPTEIRDERSTKIGGWLRRKKNRPYGSLALRYNPEHRTWHVTSSDAA